MIHAGFKLSSNYLCNNQEKYSKVKIFMQKMEFYFNIRVFLGIGNRLSMKLISILNINAIIGGNSDGYCNC